MSAALPPPPPPDIDLSQDRRAVIIATSVGTIALAILVVGLRIASRRINHAPLWVDDWLIITSLVCACAHVSCSSLYPTSRGLGKHIWANPPEAALDWAIALFIGELSYTLTMLCAKWSILAFYWRAFHVRKSIKVPICVLAVCVLCWGIAVFLVAIFQCVPVHAWWQRFDPVNPLPPSAYTCGVNSHEFFYGNAIPTIVTDVLMLALPAPYIWTLNLPRGQKVALAGVFLVGFFVTIVSGLRLSIILHQDLKDPDITWVFVDSTNWTITEANSAVVCACLPFLHPALSKLCNGTRRLFSCGSHSGHGSTRKTMTTTNTTTVGRGRTCDGDEGLDDDDSGAVRTWDGDRRFGLSSTHATAFASRSCGTYTSGGDLEADERLFVWTSPDDGRSATTVAAEGRRVAHGNNESLTSIELREMNRVRTSVMDGIVVTREVHMQHQVV
ncbi:hypothetical protein JDV02_010353 [Purpureocillium takamizusanense]|uniref:Rhodopsin domain-containing protein n=1 Tax=Purpureocillium takamizusanense TaxID=2060973 RepID=A0A9Q8VH69_9HYPO|nr:uncharacterized protein JDV02_010353 [Purpureocillium takamizusanense]UNI24619.1 hypothetical protein JDV02_010353 [Purpureocillium takamizusanense]